MCVCVLGKESSLKSYFSVIYSISKLLQATWLLKWTMIGYYVNDLADFITFLDSLYHTTLVIWSSPLLLLGDLIPTICLYNFLEKKLPSKVFFFLITSCTIIAFDHVCFPYHSCLLPLPPFTSSSQTTPFYITSCLSFYHLLNSFKVPTGIFWNVVMQFFVTFLLER